jgi:hypothetical protein
MLHPHARSCNSLGRGTRKVLTFIATAALFTGAATAAESVVVRRVPAGGIKPSAAVDATGRLHLVYFSGEPKGGDAFYVTSDDRGATFTEPVRVNNQPGSVLGASSARGPHLALGKDGIVHVLWPGSGTAKPRGLLNPKMPADSPFNGTPLLYSRGTSKEGFSEQRNVMQKTTALDGDSAIAADASGNVYIVWHGQLPHADGMNERNRAVWLARSTDSGATLSEETNILPEPTGVCACCALTASAANDGSISVLYRIAASTTERGMRALISTDGGATFTARQLDNWAIPTCPMSTASLLPAAKKAFLGAWENDGRIFAAVLPAGKATAAPAPKAAAKHPSLAQSGNGNILLTWTEGVKFGRGGNVGWQAYDPAFTPKGATGAAKDLPPNGNVAAVAFPNNQFAVIY